VISEVI